MVLRREEILDVRRDSALVKDKIVIWGGWEEEGGGRGMRE